MSTARFTAVWLVLLTLLCASCSTEPTKVGGDGGAGRATHLVTQPNRPNAEPFFRIEDHRGKLGVDGAGCVTFSSQGESALVWAPFGSTISEPGNEFATKSNRYQMGSELELKGAFRQIGKPSGRARPNAWKACVGTQEDTSTFFFVDPEA